MLKDDMIRYRRWPHGHRKKTYKFLVRALDRQIDMNIRDKNYAALQGKSNAAPAAAKKKVCKAFLRGECKDRNCPHKHPDGKRGSRAPSAATPPTTGGPPRAAGRREGRGRDRSQGRGNGKGNGKGQDRSGSPTHDKDGKQKACKFWAMGKCERENCGYSHVPADKGKKANTPTGQASDARKGGGAEGRKRSTSRQSKTPCRNFAAGNCTYGDKCIFVHDGAAGVRPAAKGAAKAAAKAAAKTAS